MENKRYPNLYIIGAPKCGTTSIANWLNCHSECFLPEVKEPHYFNSDDVVICHGGGGVGIGQSAAPGAYALRVEGATSAFNAFQNTEANFRVLVVLMTV